MSDPQTVADLYQQILGRAPEDSGAAYWQSQFGDTIDPSEVATFQAAARPELAEAIESVYEKSFGRPAETAGSKYWTNQLNSGALNSLSALQQAIRSGAQGYDKTAMADNAQYATSWDPSRLDVNKDTLWYDPEKDQWNPLAVKKQPVPVPSIGGGQSPGGAYDPSTSTYATHAVPTAVPDLTGQQYGPGTGTGSPSLGDSSGWAWRPDLGTWAGTRTGTVNGPVPYKTTDANGKVIRSWGLAAHPWDKGSLGSVGRFSLPEWDSVGYSSQDDQDPSYRAPVAHFAEGGSTGSLGDYLASIRAQAPESMGYVTQRTTPDSEGQYEQLTVERRPEFSKAGDFYRVLTSDPNENYSGAGEPHKYDIYQYIDPTNDSQADGKWERRTTPHLEEEGYLWSGVNSDQYTQALINQHLGKASPLEAARLITPGAIGQALTRPDSVMYNPLGISGAEKEWLNEAGTLDKTGYQMTPEERAAGYNMWNWTTPESEARRSGGLNPLMIAAVLAACVTMGMSGAAAAAAEAGAGAAAEGSAGAMAAGEGAGGMTAGEVAGTTYGADYAGSMTAEQLAADQAAEQLAASGQGAFNSAYPGLSGISEAAGTPTGMSSITTPGFFDKIPQGVKDAYSAASNVNKAYNLAKFASSLGGSGTSTTSPLQQATSVKQNTAVTRSPYGANTGFGNPFYGTR